MWILSSSDIRHKRQLLALDNIEELIEQWFQVDYESWLWWVDTQISSEWWDVVTIEIHIVPGSISEVHFWTALGTWCEGLSWRREVRPVKPAVGWWGWWLRIGVKVRHVVGDTDPLRSC